MKVLNQYVLVFAWLFLFAGCSEEPLSVLESTHKPPKIEQEKMEQLKDGWLNLDFDRQQTGDDDDQDGPDQENFFILDEFPVWPSAHFDILEATVKGDQLFITVEYFGGCQLHYFRLVSSTLESVPNNVFLKLYHSDRNDFCDHRIQEELVFDISALKRHYLENWKPPCVDIKMVFKDSPHLNSRLVYSFCGGTNDDIP